MGKLQSGLGIRDIANNLAGFEHENKVQVEIRLRSHKHNGAPDIMLLVSATAAGQEIGDQNVLASVSLRCSATNAQTMEGALIHALYRLDAQLASVELRGEIKSS